MASRTQRSCRATSQAGRSAELVSRLVADDEGFRSDTKQLQQRSERFFGVHVGAREEDEAACRCQEGGGPAIRRMSSNA